MVSVLQYRDLLLSEGWRLVLTIAVGTALVMISTALTLNFCYRWKRRLYKNCTPDRGTKWITPRLPASLGPASPIFMAKKIYRKTADDFLARRDRLGQHHRPDAAWAFPTTLTTNTRRHRFPAHAGNGRLRHSDYENREVIRRQLPIPVDSDFGRHVRRREPACFDGQYVPLRQRSHQQPDGALDFHAVCRRIGK